MSEHAATILSRRLHRVIEVGDSFLMVEAGLFLQWLFEEPLIRPYAVEVVQRDQARRNEWHRHYTECMAEVWVLKCRLMNQYEHSPRDGLRTRAACTNPECHWRLEQIDRIVRLAPSVHVDDLVSDLESNLKQTPLDLALGSLLVVGETHWAEGMVQEEAHRVRLAIKGLWTRSRGRVRHLPYLIRTSAGPAMQDVIDATGIDLPLSNGGSLTETTTTGRGPVKRLTSADIKDRLHHVVREIRALIGTRLSDRLVFARYKERAERFSREDFRELVAGHWQPERALTVDVARFLYDCGLDVRHAWEAPRRPAAWPARPRCIAVRACVETAGSLQAVGQALVELNALGRSTSEATGLLVVFRAGAPLLEWPERVQLPDTAVEILTIDLVADNHPRQDEADREPVSPEVLKRWVTSGGCEREAPSVGGEVVRARVSVERRACGRLEGAFARLGEI